MTNCCCCLKEIAIFYKNNSPKDYRVLAFNDRGREILKKARSAGLFPNTGEAVDHPFQKLENRCGDLYGLFAQESELPSPEQKRRLVYVP